MLIGTTENLIIKEEIKMSENEKLAAWLYVDSHGRIVLDRQKLYRHIKARRIFYISDKGKVYAYDEGYYKSLTRREVYSIIKRFIPVDVRKKSDWEAIGADIFTDGGDFCEKDFNQDENIIVVDNGVLHLDSGKLSKHSPKHLVTRKVPASYIPDANLKDAPVFEKFIYGLSLDGDEQFKVVRMLLEFIGAILSSVKGWRFKKMLLLVGPGNTGKSKIRELVMMLVGIENCVSIDLKRLNERFGTGALFSKQLAGSGDMSFMQLKEMDTVKELTGGDTLLGERKGKDIFSFVYDGYILCNANQLPYFRGDRGDWVYERFLIVECNNVIPKKQQDRRLLEKMLLEKDVIASVAINYFREAVKRGYVFTEAEGMERLRNEYSKNNNSLLSFVNECCIREKCNRTSRPHFKRMYKIWCKVNNMQPERDKDIGSLLEEYYEVKATKTTGYYMYPLSIKEDVSKELEAAVADMKDGVR
jgi:putative DNA primase/helicase